MMLNEESNTSSRIHEHEYDVFLNFRGEDTRKSFTGNLFHALRSKRFKTFMYNDSLKTGNHISATILNAIERSRIAIVVLSENYPDSAFCLNELVKIMKWRRESNNRLVIPIFYDVDPSEVRHLKGSYGKGFTRRHERRYGMHKLQIWRHALYEVSCIRGFHFKNRFLEECEYEIIQKAVKWVSDTISRYDVFLSSKEEDTRYSFGGYLYNALSQEGFKIFMNDNGCKEEGAQSSHSLVTTLENSRLSIIILSKNFAYSSSCLDELVTILEFVKNDNQLLVWPIFYKVEPTDIRHQKNSYEKAMNEHEDNYGKDSEKVKMWRSALFEVANLKGWHLKYGYEYELVEKIVETAIKI